MRNRAWALVVVALPPAIGLATRLHFHSVRGSELDQLTFIGLKAAQLAVLVVLALLLRRSWSPRLLVVLAIVAAGIVLQVVGDWNVAWARYYQTYHGPDEPWFEYDSHWGRWASGRGNLIVLFGGLAFAAVVGLTGRVRVWVAVAATLLVFVPPPSLWPAAGVLAAMLHGYVSGDDLRLPWGP